MSEELVVLYLILGLCGGYIISPIVWLGVVRLREWRDRRRAQRRWE